MPQIKISYNDSYGYQRLGTYEITRVGLFKFICDIAKGHSYEHYKISRANAIHHILNTFSFTNGMNIKSTLREIVRTIPYLEFTSRDLSQRSECVRDFTFVNLAINSRTNYYDFKDNLMYFGGKYWDKRFAKAVHRCKECGSLYFDYRELVGMRDCWALLRNLSDGQLGLDGVCSVCGYLVRCHECGELVSRNDCEEYNGRYYCSSCAEDNFYYCEECGERYYSSDGITTRGDHHFCCEDCANEQGYYWDDDADAYIKNDLKGLIGHYHDNKGCLSKVGDKKPNAKQTLCSGFEIEVDGCDEHDFDRDDYEKLLKDMGNNFVIEHDSSVVLEFISKPMTEDAVRNFGWDKALGALRDMGWQTSRHTGGHIHYSKGYLGNSDREIRNSAKKVCAFFQNHWNEVVKIAGRGSNGYCEPWGRDINEHTDFDYLADDRYFAVNLTNLDGIGTIEIRLPKGTLDPQVKIATWDFFLHIVRNAKRISWKNINNLKRWFKGITDKNTLDYIHNQRAFVGTI